MLFRLEIKDSAWTEIRTQIAYYEVQQVGLGERFYEKLDEYFNVLRAYPFQRIRYANVRCVPMKEFPFILHYVVVEETRTVELHAVLHASMDPRSHWKNADWKVNEPEIAYGVKQ